MEEVSEAQGSRAYLQVRVGSNKILTDDLMHKGGLSPFRTDDDGLSAHEESQSEKSGATCERHSPG